MKHNTMLTVASLLSLLFLTLHITDDIVRGISKAESSNIALLVLAVFLYGTLVLPERRSGHVIMLLVGFVALSFANCGGCHLLHLQDGTRIPGAPLLAGVSRTRANRFRPP